MAVDAKKTVIYCHALYIAVTAAACAVSFLVKRLNTGHTIGYGDLLFCIQAGGHTAKEFICEILIIGGQRKFHSIRTNQPVVGKGKLAV